MEPAHMHQQMILVGVIRDDRSCNVADTIPDFISTYTYKMGLESCDSDTVIANMVA